MGGRLILGGEIFENVVLYYFLFHFEYDFTPLVPYIPYTVIIIIAMFYSGHIRVTARHNSGDGGTIYN